MSKSQPNPKIARIQKSLWTEAINSNKPAGYVYLRDVIYEEHADGFLKGRSAAVMRNWFGNYANNLIAHLNLSDFTVRVPVPHNKSRNFVYVREDAAERVRQWCRSNPDGDLSYVVPGVTYNPVADAVEEITAQPVQQAQQEAQPEQMPQWALKLLESNEVLAGKVTTHSELLRRLCELLAKSEQPAQQGEVTQQVELAPQELAATVQKSTVTDVLEVAPRQQEAAPASGWFKRLFGRTASPNAA